MAKVENTGRDVVVFRDKAGEAHSLEPGEAGTFNIDADATSIQAKVNAGLLSIDGHKDHAAKTTRSQTATAPAKTGTASQEA